MSGWYAGERETSPPLPPQFAADWRGEPESTMMSLNLILKPVARRFAIATALAGMVVAATLAGASAQAAGPAQAIQAYHAGLLGVMKQAKRLGFNGRAQRLGPMISRTFDLRFLSRRIIGGKAWRALNKQQRAAYVAAFAKLTVSTYAGRFKGFSGEKFVTTGTEKIGTKYILVKTDVVKSDGDRIPLNYLMQRRSGGWKVIDVYLKGAVSEVATRRAEFRSVLRRNGIDGLIRAIEQKANAARTRS